jgi:hypothetical protein
MTPLPPPSAPSPIPSERYRESGFHVHPEPLLPAALLRAAVDRIPALVREEYDLGFPPWRRWNVGDPRKVQKIDQVHLCDRAFRVLATQRVLGEWIAAVTGADFVQVWATQLFVKPPAGGDLGTIGWHTDRENWQFWEGEVLTAWIALEDVGPDAGPLLYVEGSHRWPDAEKQGDAYDQDLGGIQGRLRRQGLSREWREVPVLLPAGGVALHSADTLHGSGENRASRPRVGLAVNVRTRRSRIKPGVEHFGYADHEGHPFYSPVIHSKRPEAAGPAEPTGPESQP